MRCDAEGQDRSGARVPPDRGHAGSGRVRAAPRRADGRAGTRARAPSERVRADGERPGVPALHGPRRRGRRQVEADGRVRRGARRSRDRPPRPVPPVRRGHHVLPAGRGAHRDRGSARGRHARGRPGQARGARRVGRGRRQDRGAGRAGDRDRGSETAPEETFWAIRTLLEHLAADRPLVFAIDDLQWAEPKFLELVEHVADFARDAPILLACMARPELLDDHPGWAGGKLNATSILVEPLGPEECGTLVANLLADDSRGRSGPHADRGGGRRTPALRGGDHRAPRR